MNAVSKWLMALALLSGPAVVDAQLATVDGGLGVYDSKDNLTWASNANLFATQYAAENNIVSTIIADWSGHSFSDSHTLYTGDFLGSAGSMTWWGAEAWVNYLDVTDYGGSNQWALPKTADMPSNVPVASSSQMATLFYGQLGGTSSWSFSTVNTNATNAGFENLQSFVYWSGTDDAAFPNFDDWTFDPGTGYTAGAPRQNIGFYALAVAPGEVGSPVPLLASAWLMLSGLGGLGIITYKRRAA